jgi:hypothetical protein
MYDVWEAIKNYYITLGEKYSVNPIIFFGIHVAATPPFLASVGWIIKNIRDRESIVVPIVIALLFFNAANIYLIIAGKNIPFWIYIIIGATTLFSGYLTYKKIKNKANE